MTERNIISVNFPRKINHKMVLEKRGQWDCRGGWGLGGAVFTFVEMFCTSCRHTFYGTPGILYT